MTELKNKTVFITGASIGIGRETAVLFAKEKCKLVITYFLDEKEGKKTADECRANGALEVLLLPLNVMDEKSIQDCVTKIVQKFGSIDILVNNAGIVVWKDLKDHSMQEIREQVQTNLTGLMQTTLACLPHTKEMILNIASGAGITAYGGLAPYCATKFGVRGFTQGLAQEISIPVYAINPGTIATRMNNFQGLPPSRVAEVIIKTAKRQIKKPSGSDINIWEYYPHDH